MDRTGRPLKYENEDDLKLAIDKYFDSCNEEGKEKPFTVTGLALAVGLSRRQLIEYSNREKFPNTIKVAKQICEQHAEEFLYSGKNTSGAIFSLKNNWGWRDQLDVGPDQSQAENIKKLTDDELEAEIKRVSSEGE
ncbi:MAG: DNA-packaging protein [Desulfatitalea sp.]|nr:DNA-packaging protein [Desulfatitalea sp.]